MKFKTGDIIRAINNKYGTYAHFIIYDIDGWQYVAYCIEDRMYKVTISFMYESHFEKVA